jgi:hypothetical protein
MEQALPANIRLCWKGLPGTNALAYYEKSLHTAVKSFITLAPGVNPINILFFATDNKLERSVLTGFLLSLMCGMQAGAFLVKV